MTTNGLFQLALYVVVLLALAKPLGTYMARVYEGRPFGLDGRDRPLKFRLLHVVEFTPDGGQIQREQVWLDMAAIMQQLPQD